MFNRSGVGTSNRWELKHSVLDIFSILCMLSVSTYILIQSFQAHSSGCEHGNPVHPLEVYIFCLGRTAYQRKFGLMGVWLLCCTNPSIRF